MESNGESRPVDNELSNYTVDKKVSEPENEVEQKPAGDPNLPEVYSPPSGHSSRSRSRSRSKEKVFVKKDTSKMTPDELKEYEKERKRQKKKNRKKNKRPYEDLLNDPQVINNIKKAITEDKHIPEKQKVQFTKIELNPLALCIANLPLNVISQELMQYFNTFLKGVFTKYADMGKDPVKRIELTDTKKYCVLHMQDKEIAEELFNIGRLDYQTSKLKVD